MQPVFISLAVTLAVQALVSMALVTVPVLAPAAAPDVGLPATYVGFYVGAMYLGAMLSSLASGTFIVRYGAIRVSQMCLGLCALGLAVTATGLPALLVPGALLIGFGYGPTTPASSHILAKTTPPHLMSLTFSLKQTGVPLGGMLAGALVPGMVLLAGWRNACLIVAVLCLIVLAVAQPTRRDLDSDRKPSARLSFGSAGEAFRLVMAYPRLREMALLSFLYATMQLCLVSYLVIFLTKRFDVSLVTAGFTLAVAQGAGVVGRILWGAAADRFISPRRMLGLLGLTMAGCAIIASVSDASWPFFVIIVLSALWGATAIGWNGVYLAEVARYAPPGKAGLATGGSLFFTFFGVVMGPAIFGLIVEATGSYSVGFVAYAVPILLTGLFMLGSRGIADNEANIAPIERKESA